MMTAKMTGHHPLKTRVNEQFATHFTSKNTGPDFIHREFTEYNNFTLKRLYFAYIKANLNCSPLKRYGKNHICVHAWLSDAINATCSEKG